ncbi:MAG: hypothetical protein J6T15_05180 [Bacilli bacterium]|nr:hypothetical protein [Bacilli bacterium]
MKAYFKDNNKLMVVNLRADELLLVDEFVELFNTYQVEFTPITNSDDVVDGITFTITDRPRKKIEYKDPFLQILTLDMSTTIDLELDEETSVEVINTEPNLRVTIEDKIINIEVVDVETPTNTEVHYVVYARLTKEDYDTAIVPINIIVLYKDFGGTTDYEELENLPQINNTTLIGNKSLSQIGAQEEMDTISNSELLDIIDDVFNN